MLDYFSVGSKYFYINFVDFTVGMSLEIKRVFY
jgi:hypothetical protein